MRSAHFRGIVAIAMVAPGEDGDRIDAGLLQSTSELLRIEICSDVRDQG
jgi:hypothetical protein